MAGVIASHPKKTEIDAALLAGESLRKVAELAGVSHQAVNNYRKTVLLPAKARAEAIAQVERIISKTSTSAPNEAIPSEQITALTKAVIAGDSSTLWTSRADSLWTRGDKCLSDAELSKDYSAITGVMNQLHRNLELTGRAWGVLRENEGAGVHVENMLVVLPRADRPELSAAPADTGQVIDAVADNTPGDSV